jgi:integrase
VFASVKPPRCDEPDVRIVAAKEKQSLYDWLAKRWNNWRLIRVYLDVLAWTGWRATETAGIREEDSLADGFVRIVSMHSKTRKPKVAWLPPELLADLQACSANGWAFGRFSDEFRRLLLLWKKQPHNAARVREFAPARLVGWLQDELKRFNDEQAKETPSWRKFTLHDFRRTAITGMQMAGVSEKEASIAVGVTPEVMRRHYEDLNKQAIAKKTAKLRLAAESA